MAGVCENDEITSFQIITEKKIFQNYELYEEFNDLSIHLASKSFRNDEPVEGYVLMDIKPGYQFSISDVVVECKGIFFCTYVASRLKEMEQAYLSTQRGASPFVGEPLAGGVYDFPFSFRIPVDIPASFFIGSHLDDWNVENGQLSFKIRAYVIPDPTHPLKREILSVAKVFLREIAHPCMPKQISCHFASKKALFSSKGLLGLQATLNDDKISQDMPFSVLVDITNPGKIHIRKAQIKMVQEMSSYYTEYNPKNTGIPAGKTVSFRKVVIDKTVILSKNFVRYPEGEKILVQLKPKFSKGCIIIEENSEKLAPSTSLSHTFGTLSIDYYIVVSLHPSFSTKLKMKIPLVLYSYPPETQSSSEEESSYRLPRYSFESNVSDCEFAPTVRLNTSPLFPVFDQMRDLDFPPQHEFLSPYTATQGNDSPAANNALGPRMCLSSSVPNLQIFEGPIPTHIHSPVSSSSCQKDPSLSLPKYEDVVRKPSLYYVPHSVPLQSPRP